LKTSVSVGGYLNWYVELRKAQKLGGRCGENKRERPMPEGARTKQKVATRPGKTQQKNRCASAAGEIEQLIAEQKRR